MKKKSIEINLKSSLMQIHCSWISLSKFIIRRWESIILFSLIFYIIERVLCVFKVVTEEKNTLRKSCSFRSYSGPHLDWMRRDKSVFSSNAGKMRITITPNTETFNAEINGKLNHRLTEKIPKGHLIFKLFLMLTVLFHHQIDIRFLILKWLLKNWAGRKNKFMCKHMIQS